VQHGVGALSVTHLGLCSGVKLFGVYRCAGRIDSCGGMTSSFSTPV